MLQSPLYLIKNHTFTYSCFFFFEFLIKSQYKNLYRTVYIRFLKKSATFIIVVPSSFIGIYLIGKKYAAKRFNIFVKLQTGQFFLKRGFFLLNMILKNTTKCERHALGNIGRNCIILMNEKI